MPDPTIEAMARAIAETPVMCGTYSMDGEDAEALAQAAYAVSGCDDLRKRVSELEEELMTYHRVFLPVKDGGWAADEPGWGKALDEAVAKARATLSRGE
jgi:hypothetical protein